ncbi:MAG: class I SAM-dependent methyltransferase [Proteobacteria bacterium]|nr:MAG: class I SAM-dependent methyltransferase [Pseudomonadota bacterium]
MVPDPVVRAGIRQLLKQRLAELDTGDAEGCAVRKQSFIDAMRQAPIALVPDLANEQHYEVPATFFAEVLGRHRKYSCCLWPEGVADLEVAERAALELTCERAGIHDGQKILELGCGWGALTLWIARRYPAATIDAVSNSSSQREYIESEALRRGLDNIQVRTIDMNAFHAGKLYDRIVSVEMFEHMRNYAELFSRIHDWMLPGGRFFMHIFAHRSEVYEFVDEGPGDWMGRHFFSGGMMPSDDLPLHFQEKLVLERRWRLDGRHYEKTCNAWLDRADQRRNEILPILRTTYGAGDAHLWLTRWRVFFMACAELFGYRGGAEWGVSHYLFRKSP